MSRVDSRVLTHFDNSAAWLAAEVSRFKISYLYYVGIPQGYEKRNMYVSLYLRNSMIYLI